jgi:hypothetical protein
MVRVVKIFSVGNLHMAAECTGTYLLLKPDDATMLHNRDYYAKRDSVVPDDFQARKVCALASYLTPSH